jgi:hypothetical protein
MRLKDRNEIIVSNFIFRFNVFPRCALCFFFENRSDKSNMERQYFFQTITAR